MSDASTTRPNRTPVITHIGGASSRLLCPYRTAPPVLSIVALARRPYPLPFLPASLRLTRGRRARAPGRRRLGDPLAPRAPQAGAGGGARHHRVTARAAQQA